MNVKMKIILLCTLTIFTTSCMGVLSSLDKAAKESGLDFLALALTGAGGSQQVDPNNGGVIQVATMSLTVPIGALNGPTTITYENEEVPEAQNSTVPVQAAYTFGPAGLQFNTSATLEICYDGNDLASKGFEERTVEIQYVNPNTGEYESMGGDVNLATNCVSTEIYHFSTYILTAQILSVGASAPNIGVTQFLPGTVIDGLPATVRTVITPDWNSNANVASATFYYRTPGGGAFTALPMSQDSWDTQGRYYTATIPDTDVTSAGIEYYVEAFDTLNASRLRPATAPVAFDFRAGDIPDATTPLRLWPPVTNMAAGFSRDLALQVKGNSAATYFPVIAETTTFVAGRGTSMRPNLMQVRFTAQTVGPSNLEATYGGLTSAPISTVLPVPMYVTPGMLDRIEILYTNVVLPDPFEMNGLETRQLDAAGYDAFNNFMYIKPDFTTTGGIGTFGGPLFYGQITAANVGIETEGQITATLGGFSKSANTTIYPLAAVTCLFNSVTIGQGFDMSCVFGP